jgi:cytoskeletal protein CcmA (bactofilin family)
MLGKKNAGFREGIDTIVSTNTTFTGTIESEGTVRVDGKVNGDIIISGDLYVGDQAQITGNIDAANVHLSGKVEGNISAKGLLKILSTAKLYGDIKVNSFVADEGALFQGKCTMMEALHSDKHEKNKNSKMYKKGSVVEDNQ